MMRQNDDLQFERAWQGKTFDMVLIIKVLSFLKHFLVGFFEVYALVWDKENEMRRVHVHCHGVNNKGRAWRYL